jgi:uridylate kinase
VGFVVVIVVKLSGSVFSLETKDEPLKKILKPIEDGAKNGKRFVIVAGGGEVARKYIELGRQFGMDDSSLDQMGIEISRVNAMLVNGCLNSTVYPSIPKTLEEVAIALKTSDIVSCGGFHPGHSTNAVAALIAERVRASLFVNTTDVEGVYSSDPRKDKHAKLLSNIEPAKLSRMLEDAKMIAGSYDLMDLVALKVIERSRIPTVICKCNPDIIQAALDLKDVGTKILV